MTGVYLSDSWSIAEYLEKQYPDTPSLFPNNTKGLQAALTDGHHASLANVWAFAIPATHAILNPESEKYFRRTREMTFGVKMEEITPKGERAVEEWAKFKANLDKVDTWFTKTDDKGPFILGDTISWTDLNVASWTTWWRAVWGEDSEEWKDVASWNGGRWNDLLVALEKYSRDI